MSAPAATHPIVRLDYRVRRIFVPLVVLVAVSVQAVEPEPIAIPMWLLFLAHGFLWPPVAYRIASRAPDGKEAEHRNLLVDAFLLSFLFGICDFSPALGIVIPGTFANNAAVAGPRFAGLAVLPMGLGMLAGGFLNGFHVDLLPGIPGIVLSAFVLCAYQGFFGWVANVQTRNLLDAKRHMEEQNRELVRLREAADAANVAKSIFLASMSHELRTPLNAIIGYTDLLEMDAGDGSPEMREDLKKIKSASTHLLGLIDNVLDLAKIEAGRMRFVLEDVDVAQVAEEAAHAVRPLIERKGVAFALTHEQNPGVIRGDATRLRQVLLNLLSNAMKFTEKGRVELALGRSVENGREVVRCRVTDTGIGMTPEQAGRLFQPFVQAEAGTSRKYGGTGLGLSLSRQLCQRMGGDVSVTSAVGDGTTFSFWLPVDGAEIARLASGGTEILGPGGPGDGASGAAAAFGPGGPGDGEGS